MPFDKYLSRLIDGNLRALVINPKYADFGGEDVLNLIEAWESINTEFNAALSGSGSVGYVHILADIARLENKVNRIYDILASLKIRYHEGLVQDLKKSGILNLPTPTDLKLETIEAETKQWIIQIHEKKVLYLSKQVKVDLKIIKQALHDNDYDLSKTLHALGGDADKTAPTYELFEGILAKIDPKLQAKDITTMRFVILYNELRNRLKRETERHGIGAGK